MGLKDNPTEYIRKIDKCLILSMASFVALYSFQAISLSGWSGYARGVWLSALSGLLFLLPGYALLSVLLPKSNLDLAQQLIVSAGLTAAIAPLLLLFGWLFGLKLNRLIVAALLIACVSVILWRKGSDWIRRFSLWKMVRRIDLLNILLIFVSLLIVFIRFLVVRDLTVPMWGDSYHHTMIAQLIVHNQGLFNSWEPYVPLRTFTYHFGFHAAVAFFHWITGISVIRSVIIVGQIFNILAVLTLYPLTVRLTENRWSGVVAVLIAGLLSPMPMYYVNWGRYTQLAGQVILPVALFFCMEVAEHESWDVGTSALAVIALAGLVVTHYRVVLFYLLFLAAWFPAFLARKWQNQKNIWEIILRTLAIGLAALIIVLPWIRNIFTGRLPQIYAYLLRGQVNSFIYNEYNAIGDITFFVPWYLIVLGIGGGVWGMIRRRWQVVVVMGWIVLLFLLANPYVLHLPGTGIVNNFAILIALYMPASILSGFSLGSLLEMVRIKLPRASYVVGFLLIVVALLAARARLLTLDPHYILVTKADEKAMAWIRQNTPADAKFLVNSFFAHGNSVIVGSDAGWWIPLLTGRANTVPPITYASETSLVPNYIIEVNEFARKLQSTSLDTVKALQLLRENDVTHIYIGEKGGSIQPEKLLQSSHYRVIYHQDNVWIFEVNYGGTKGSD